MHPEYDSLSLPELVERLEDVNGLRTPVGWSPEDAVTKSTLERRIFEVVTQPLGDSVANGVPCEMHVRIKLGENGMKSRVTGLVNGGILLDRVAGSETGGVEIEVDAEERGGRSLKLRGNLARRGSQPVVSLLVNGEADERHVRRFLRELLSARAG